MAHYSTVLVSDSELLARYERLAKFYDPNYILPPSTEFYNGYASTDNVQLKMIWIQESPQTNFYKIGGNLTNGIGGRACYLQISCNEWCNNQLTGNTYDHYLLLTNGVNINSRRNIARSQQNGAKMWLYEFRGATYNDYYGTEMTYNDSWWNEFNRLMHPTNAILKTKLDNIKIDVTNLKAQYVTQYPAFHDDNLSVSHQGTTYASVFSYDSLPFPVFREDDYLKAKNYLLTGNEEGSIDPFDPQNPEKTTNIENYKTNFKIFVSPVPDNPNATKFSVIGYNTEYIEAGESMHGLYKMPVFENWTTMTQNVTRLIQNGTQSKFPTVGFIHEFEPNVPYQLAINFCDNDETKTSGKFYVNMTYDGTKETNFKIRLVTCSVTGVFNTDTTKTNVVDGYRYTSTNSGEWVEILFRTPTMDDLHYDYPDHDDVENEGTGTDTTFAGASGLHTYAITDNDFKVINSKLWTTDWTQVFKSTTIDPVKCVIACKSIPFTANAVNSADVFIANMNTGLHKNYIKTVKSFNVGTGTHIPAFNGDFTDITMTRIHCYLPYIGWVELPASECVSRVAYSNVRANSKYLSFKYIVDFVDGTCRCIISVNGTERWFFDGNCSIDIPVTSDNHTQAVSNALRSGLQTGLSIVSGVVGAVSGNAGAVAGGIVGTMTSAPNIFPTYNYTATSNGSGYINASMNTNIILVVERPNVVRPMDFSKRVGRPCGLTMSLGGLRGFTKCTNVDVSGITATDNELSMIKSLLETGVYL